MQSQKKFSLLRRILTALGLSTEAVEDIVERIEDFLSVKDERTPEKAEYPYSTRDHFLSPAEYSFFMILKTAVSDSALISIKVGLGDLFYANCDDGSKHRIYTNKIDRKHVDFLLCDPKTVQPILGIELDDKSHQRSDRQVRDEFVENVFQAANLPLVRIPVKHSYSTSDLQAILNPYLAPGRQCQVCRLLPQILSRIAPNAEAKWYYEPPGAVQIRAKSSGDARISLNVEAFSSTAKLLIDYRL